MTKTSIEGLIDIDAKTCWDIIFLSDNGAEFKGALAQTLAEQDLTHDWTYAARICPLLT